MADNFANANYRLSVVKTHVDRNHPRIQSLLEVSECVEDYNTRHDLWSAVQGRLLPRRWFPQLTDSRKVWLCRFLSRLRPDFAVVSQGQNFDGLDLVDACRSSGVPYILIAQKAADSAWPHDRDRERMRSSYVNAQRAYFVSKHNLNLTELQIGVRLTNAELVSNPFLTPVTEPLPWPKSEDGSYKLACVGRLAISEKGQDILLQALARDRWQSRPVHVTFFGEGEHSDLLKRASDLLGLNSVHFAGFTSDVVNIWKTHHALVLPSRSEGLPLTLIEAMLCGRPGIVTNVGGNTELVTDNDTGFVAAAATVDALDDALERAWAHRSQWQSMGEKAAKSIRENVPTDPCRTLATKIMELMNDA